MRTGNISERRNMGRPQQETEQRGRIGSPVRPKKEDNAGASFVKNDDQTPAADVDTMPDIGAFVKPTAWDLAGDMFRVVVGRKTKAEQGAEQVQDPKAYLKHQKEDETLSKDILDGFKSMGLLMHKVSLCYFSLFQGDR